MRKKVLENFNYLKIFDTNKKNQKISSYFGENIFDLRTMEHYLSRKTLLAFKNWIKKGSNNIDKKSADEIAEAMKTWAVENGTTHYTHWFQPLTGLTAEKHDAFLDLNMPGQVIETFSGNQLIVGEPDASSFPSGGIRSTFEARGYTAWDPSSPAFIMETDTSKTLCIPSIFISYTGEALDKKLPLLRSDKALSNAAVKLLKIFGKDCESVSSTCGAEQEYFLIDRNYYNLRQDLVLAGRTLIGAPSPKGQQLDDQYFGSIKERVMNFMNAVEEEAYKYGIPLSTRHNEVAPNQYEFAPIFEETNLAADHNQLLMEILKRVAQRMGLVCLLNEKPFAGINGSGKHVNWSLSDDKGNNLLNPGKTPEDNLQFLTLLVSIIRGVYKHADILYSSVVSAGNEHRLGANEAPPAIISVFLGAFLDKILNQIEKGKTNKLKKNDIVDLGLDKLPQFAKDNTDRNRTSPFAFTGAKFEFRAVGSAQNISLPLTFINTIMADSIEFVSNKINEKLNGNTENFKEDILEVLAEIITESKNIRFEGNNYSEEWVKEAEKRGLLNQPSAARALKALIKKENIELFKKYNVFSKNELESRYHIWIEHYNNLLEIEANTLIEMTNANVIPDAIHYQKLLLSNFQKMNNLKKDAGLDNNVVNDMNELLIEVSNKIYYVRKNLKTLISFLNDTQNLDPVVKSDKIFEEMKPLIAHIRKHIDELEQVVPDNYWSLPKYREMLFML